MNSFDDRSKVILKYNVIGVVVNMVLGLSKVVFGVLINAHAIMIDGVNSLSDMTASIVSVFSTFLSNKSSDKKHPLGYGRLEYIASFVITIMIIYIGGIGFLLFFSYLCIICAIVAWFIYPLIYFYEA